MTQPGTSAPVLVSVNVGLPKNVPWQGKTVYTGVWKQPVPGPAMVRRLNVDGDGQGDLAGHGGEQRAVLVYQIESYRYWQRYFGREDFTYGQFGENLTVDGLPDDEVCIGDRYRIGQAEFEVTQPRVTCYRVGLRLGEPELPALLVGHHRPGFYLRVITEGHVQAGDRIIKTRTGPHALSVADTDALLYLPGRDRDKLLAAVHIPALSPGWQGSFRDLLAADGAPPPDAGPAWLHGARGPHQHPFAAEAHDLLASLPHASEHVFYSNATSSERTRGFAAAGRLTKEALAGLGIPAGASAYICGPASFMTDMRDALTALGLDSARIHTELFGALASINPGLTSQTRPPPHQPPGPPGTGPLVTFARSGITAPFGSHGHSVLDLADACDVPTRWSCRTGVCHTCVTPLLSGDVTYSPDPLEPPADGQVLICCARPATEIVLDM